MTIAYNHRGGHGVCYTVLATIDRRSRDHVSRSHASEHADGWSSAGATATSTKPQNQVRAGSFKRTTILKKFSAPVDRPRPPRLSPARACPAAAASTTGVEQYGPHTTILFAQAWCRLRGGSARHVANRKTAKRTGTATSRGQARRDGSARTAKGVSEHREHSGLRHPDGRTRRGMKETEVMAEGPKAGSASTSRCKFAPR